MKTAFAALLLVLSAGCDMASVAGSGNLVSKDMTVGEFQKIEAGGSFHVDVTQGDVQSVAVTADDNLWEYLDVRTTDGTLQLAMKPGSYRNAHVSAKIVVPHTTGISLSGACGADLHGISNPDNRIQIHVSGASSVQGEVRAKDLTLDLSGASHAKLQGQAQTVNVEASGASHAALENFKGDVGRARVSGASGVAFVANSHLDYEVSGASHLTYAGSPVIDHGTTSGASDAHAAK